MVAAWQGVISPWKGTNLCLSNISNTDHSMILFVLWENVKKIKLKHKSIKNMNFHKEILLNPEIGIAGLFYSSNK